MIDGYGVCFNEWVLDKDIKNELRLLLIISSLSAEKGYCYASNEYLAKLFEETEETISRKIKKLVGKNYIEIEYDKRGCEILARRIRLTKISIDGYQKYQSTIDKNVKENNKILNNISNNKKKEIYKERKFKKPTLEEIKKYCDERNNGINPSSFYDFYQSKNWMIGKNKMKDWKACVRTWEQRQPKKVIPEWFNKEIGNDEEIEYEDFNEFLKEIRGKND